LLLIVLEFMIPSAGMLGIGAACALIAALFLAFSDSATSGLFMSGGVVFLVPALLYGAIRVWPSTPIGRRILNLPPQGEVSHMQDDSRTSELKSLMGRVGVARTNLLPSGLIEIEGRRYDAVAVGAAVDQGNFVEVFSVEAGKIRVRPTNRRPAIQLHKLTADELGLDELQ
jgi:membrane-bound serine protease (ClpP class)